MKDFKAGQLCQGFVVSAGAHGVFVALSRTVTARVGLADLGESYVVADRVKDKSRREKLPRRPVERRGQVSVSCCPSVAALRRRTFVPRL